MLPAVDLIRIKKRSRYFFRRNSIRLKFAEKTAFVTGIACCFPDLIYFQYNSIIVAINEYFFDFLNIAGAFAFAP